MGNRFLVTLCLSVFLYSGFLSGETANFYSSRLIHRFSDEAASFWTSRGRNVTLPRRGSMEHMRVLLGSDFKRQRLKLGSQNQLLVPSQGSETFFYGNDMGWLHYMWLDIGTPNVSFLVALDAGSDLLWVPCACKQCAPLSSSYYSMLGRDLSEYNPSLSSTSKNLSCSHQLCELGPKCQSPKEQCPYSVNYYSENTSSSDFFLRTNYIYPQLMDMQMKDPYRLQSYCGSKQSGIYLDSSAPDGLMGLGPGEISVPSLLAKSGLVPHSFSFCFDNSYSGRIYFGDRGPTIQRSTPFLPFHGEYSGYFVKVDDYCIGSICLEQTGFKVQVDSGTSFTYLPDEAYKMVVAEFDKQVNATRSGIQDFPYCYRAGSHGQPNVPGMRFIFAMNQSFIIENSMFHVINDQGDDLYCLGILGMYGDIGIIGQNFMQGYRLVFDWENLKLGWSHSDCQDISESSKEHMTPPPNDQSANPLPTNEQQRTPHGHAVAPAVAGRTPARPSAASPPLVLCHYCEMIFLLLQLTLWLPYPF